MQVAHSPAEICLVRVPNNITWDDRAVSVFECLCSTRNNFRHKSKPVACQVSAPVTWDQATQTGDEFILSLQPQRSLRGGAVSLPDLSLSVEEPEETSEQSAASPSLPAPAARCYDAEGARPKVAQYGSTDVRERKKLAKAPPVIASSPGECLFLG